MKKIYYIPVKKENMEPLRVAAYCRVSTKKETQLASWLIKLCHIQNRYQIIRVGYFQEYSGIAEDVD